MKKPILYREITKEEILALFGVPKWEDAKQVLERANMVLNAHYLQMIKTPASRSHHCNFEGGLIWHTYKVMKNIQLILKDDETVCELFGVFHEHTIEHKRFELLFYALVHDIGKIFVYYKEKNKEKWQKNEYLNHHVLGVSILANLDIPMCGGLLNMLMYHHGGWSDGAKKGIELYPETILIHAADSLAVAEERSEKYQ